MYYVYCFISLVETLQVDILINFFDIGSCLSVARGDKLNITNQVHL